ncbi:MAG: methylated-DNA--[protein]-cysteine S-methyltransferase [Thermoplasmatota archaeon]
MPEGSPGGLHIFDYASPIGNLIGVISEEGLLSLSMDRGNDERVTCREPESGDTARTYYELVEQLDSFFEKELDVFTIDLDTSRISDFRRSIYSELRNLKFGNLITYGDLARRAGVPGGARAVGGAMAGNPYLLVVPCHRVVSKGKGGSYGLGGFSAGIGIKKDLLTLEGTVSDIEM